MAVTIPSWLNLAEEENIELWGDIQESTNKSYKYCNSFTVSDGVLTPVSPTTISLNHSGDFNTLKNHYVLINTNEWYLIPSDSVITVYDFSANPTISASKCRHARAGRLHWSELNTVTFRNACAMSEITIQNGITWTLEADIEYTLTFGYEVKGVNGGIAIMNPETTTIAYDEAISSEYWDWIKGLYVSKDRIYYIPENATFTFTHQNEYRKVNVTPAVQIEVATMPSYPYVIEERPNQREDYILIGYRLEIGDVSHPITFYNNCSVGTNGKLLYSNPQQLTLTAPSDAEWEANGAQYYSAQYQGKYIETGSIISSNALITREVEKIPVHYKKSETTSYYAWWTRFGASTYVPCAPFAVNKKTVYYDSILFNEDTGEITGVGEHTYYWDTQRISNFPFVGKYTFLSSSFEFGAFGTWYGWCIYNHMYFEYDMYNGGWIVNVGIRPVKAVGDQFITKYSFNIPYNYIRTTQNQFQSDVCLKNTGRKQYIDTGFNCYSLRAQLSWEMDTALEPALKTSISDFVYGNLWDFAIGHLDSRIVNIVQMEYVPVQITRAEGWYFYNDTDTPKKLKDPASAWTNIKYFDVDTRTQTFVVNGSTSTGWVSTPQSSPYVFRANGQTDDFTSAEISVYGLRQSGYFDDENTDQPVQDSNTYSDQQSYIINSLYDFNKIPGLIQKVYLPGLDVPYRVYKGDAIYSQTIQWGVFTSNGIKYAQPATAEESRKWNHVTNGSNTPDPDGFWILYASQEDAWLEADQPISNIYVEEYDTTVGVRARDVGFITGWASLQQREMFLVDGAYEFGDWYTVIRPVGDWYFRRTLHNGNINYPADATEGYWYYTGAYEQSEESEESSDEAPFDLFGLPFRRQDFIPCIKKSTWDAGLYDMSGGVFYNNSGDGFFDYIGSKLYIFDDEASEAKENNARNITSMRNLIPANSGTNPNTLTDPYIISSGLEYIDTGYKPNKNTRITMRFMENASMGTTLSLLGVKDKIVNYSNGSDLSPSLLITSNSMGFGINLYRKDINLIRVRNSNVHDLILISGGTCYYDRFKFRLSSQAKFPEITTQNNLYLFGVNLGEDVTRLSAYRLYYIKIYDGSNLVRDMIPAIRNADNAVGLYDNITQEFYENKGSGAFTYGGTGIYRYNGSVPQSTIQELAPGDVGDYIQENNALRIYKQEFPESVCATIYSESVKAVNNNLEPGILNSIVGAFSGNVWNNIKGKYLLYYDKNTYKNKCYYVASNARFFRYSGFLPRKSVVIAQGTTNARYTFYSNISSSITYYDSCEINTGGELERSGSHRLAISAGDTVDNGVMNVLRGKYIYSSNKTYYIPRNINEVNSSLNITYSNGVEGANSYTRVTIPMHLVSIGEKDVEYSVIEVPATEITAANAP